jgi:hypothetical protein
MIRRIAKEKGSQLARSSNLLIIDIPIASNKYNISIPLVIQGVGGQVLQQSDD